MNEGSGLLKEALIKAAMLESADGFGGVQGKKHSNSNAIASSFNTEIRQIGGEGEYCGINQCFTKQNCEEFAAKIASKEPVPGGGGASAYVGAIGVALGAMVGNLTSGKAKYADVQEEIEALIEKSEALRAKLQSLVDEDARLFLPLVKAYGMPAATEAEQAAKAAALEDALKAACEVPLAIMAACCEGIELNAEYAEKGSRLAVSDAGAGAVFCKAALVGASLNVFINTKLMTDRVCAQRMERDANTMIEQYGSKADAALELAFERM